MHLTDDNFDQIVNGNSLPILVDFSASWCNPCKSMIPIVQKLEGELQGRALVCTVDIDDSPQITAKLGIRGVPTFMVFKGGTVTASTTGAKSREKLLDLLDL